MCVFIGLEKMYKIHALKTFSNISIISIFLISLIGCSSSGSESSGSSSSSSAKPILIKDVEYKKGRVQAGELSLLLDLHQASSECKGRRPTVLYVHGGSFRTGDKYSDDIKSVATLFNQKGINMVSINYRLIGDKPILSSDFQAIENGFNELGDTNYRNGVFAATEDATDATVWLEQNAQTYCIDQTKIALMGASAGAVTVMRVAYGLDDYNIYMPKPVVLVNYFGSILKFDDLEAGEAPFITVHGTDDRTAEFDNSVKLAEQADRVGVKVKYSFYKVKDGGHGFSVLSAKYQGESMLEKTVKFVEAHFNSTSPVYETVLVE